METVDKKNEASMFDVFGDEFDRFDFPPDIYRVTAGNGGEALLIDGGEKTALLDCGMAYCGEQMIVNLRARLSELKRDTLDYVLLSHSHYDHIGALPYVVREFPDVTVCGSEHCSSILGRPNARTLIRELGITARELYAPGSTTDIPVDGLRVDRILKDGDVIDLGEAKIVSLETKGHTDCSMSFLLEPLSLLFASESLGIIEAPDYVYAPILKSFDDALISMRKCVDYAPKHICLAHFGMLPDDFTDKYWKMFEESCLDVLDFVRDMKSRGLSPDEMTQKYIDKYWILETEAEHPMEAYEINTRAVIKAALKAIDMPRLHA